MNPDPYRALGVRPFINCCSVRTMHGGSLMLPQVRAAVDAASRQFVNLDEADRSGPGLLRCARNDSSFRLLQCLLPRRPR